MSVTQQPDPVSAASDSQTELSRRKVRPKSVTAPTTRSQSQKDSATEDVFGSQTLQRTAGNPDLRDDPTSGRSDQITQGRDNYPMTPPRLSIQPTDRIVLTPGGAQRIGDLPAGINGERRGARHDDVSTGTTPPSRFPVSEVTTEPRVQDMAEYIALRVRHDLEVFRHEIRQHVAHVVRDAVSTGGTPTGRTARTPEGQPSTGSIYISPRSTPELGRGSATKSTASRRTPRVKKRRPVIEDSSTEEEPRPQPQPRSRATTPVITSTTTAGTTAGPTAGVTTVTTTKSTEPPEEKPRATERGITMPVFKGDNWVAFQIKFATYCNRYQLDDYDKLDRLKMALEDTACRVLYSRDPELWTYQELMKALENRYGHSKSYPMVERELRRIKRKPSQTLQDLADEIREISRKTHMEEHTRDQLTRSAFMGALDDDTQMIHYIDKRDPARESLASALEIAERYERQNGSTVADMATRLDAAQTADETHTVAAYGTGPSPLTKQVNQNTQLLQDVQQTLKTMMQTLTQKNTATNSTSTKQNNGQVWPGSNYRGKNFIPNYKPPGAQQRTGQDGDNNNVNQQQQQGGAQQQQQQPGQAANQQANASAPQQQNAGGQNAGGNAGAATNNQ